MASKKIMIDLEAYRRLKQVQRENESISQAIKRVVPKPISTDELIELFRVAGTVLSEGFYRGVESALVARANCARKRQIHRAPLPLRNRSQA
jgi:predicted CopG family antitoxin